MKILCGCLSWQMPEQKNYLPGELKIISFAPDQI